VLITSGPCTVGPGQVVSRDRSEAMRTHHDLSKGRAPWFAAAANFYDGIAHRLIENGQSLDIFAASLDQARPRPRLPCQGLARVLRVFSARPQGAKLECALHLGGSPFELALFRLADSDAIALLPIAGSTAASNSSQQFFHPIAGSSAAGVPVGGVKG
jgi:hypothetical protein